MLLLFTLANFNRPASICKRSVDRRLSELNYACKSENEQNAISIFAMPFTTPLGACIRGKCATFLSHCANRHQCRVCTTVINYFTSSNVEIERLCSLYRFRSMRYRKQWIKASLTPDPAFPRVHRVPSSLGVLGR